MFKDILIPVELSDPATWDRPLAKGVEFAQHFGARLHVMTVVPQFDYPIVASYFPADFEQKAHERIDRELHTLVGEHVPEGVVVQTIVAAGTAYEQILEVAKDSSCDLIIMARSSASRHHFMVGSNTERVVRHTKSCVLVMN